MTGDGKRRTSRDVEHLHLGASDFCGPYMVLRNDFRPGVPLAVRLRGGQDIPLGGC